MSLDTSKQRLCISKEWLYGITARSSKKVLDKVAQQASSKAHNVCIEDLKNRALEPLEKAMQTAQNATWIEVTCKDFRSAYLIAWKHSSFRTHRYVIKLQQQKVPWRKLQFLITRSIFYYENLYD